MTVSAAKCRYLEVGVLSRLSHLRFTTKQAVEGAFSGRHRSRRQGGASEFLEHRQYSPGDDIRRLDWKVLGRTGRPYLRIYQDETNLVATVALDVSRSMLFGSRSDRDTTGSKLDFACYLAAALGYVVIREGDRFGLALVSSALDAFHPPAATTAQLEAVGGTLESIQPVPQTDLGGGLREMFSRLTKRGVLVIVSDFLDADMERLFAAVRLFRHRSFGVMFIHVVHPLEERLPSGAAYRFIGLEGEGARTCSPQEIAAVYERRFSRFASGLRSRAIAAGCAYHRFSTAVPYVEQLRTLLVEKQGQ